MKNPFENGSIVVNLNGYRRAIVPGCRSEAVFKTACLHCARPVAYVHRPDDRTAHFECPCGKLEIQVPFDWITNKNGETTINLPAHQDCQACQDPSYQAQWYVRRDGKWVPE